jgi:hypothetical protein
VLKEQLQFAGSHLLVSLLSFNLGIEIGQLAVLCVFVPALALLLRGRMAGRMGIIVLSAIIANIAWQWMMPRGEVLWQTPWPQLTVPGLMTLVRWVVALALAVAASKPSPNGSSANGRGSDSRQRAGLTANPLLSAVGRARSKLSFARAPDFIPGYAIYQNDRAIDRVAGCRIVSQAADPDQIREWLGTLRQRTTSHVATPACW